ncbi:MAG: ATP-binding cassette domain-containing protein [Rhizobiaceae bacterium]
MISRQNSISSLVTVAAIVVVWIGLSLLIENPYYRLLLTLVPIWASFAVSWNIFSGYSGLISFGHAAFFGLGAYTVALGLIHFDLTPWFGLPVAALVGALAGAIVGYATFRLRGLYFALAMLAYPLCFVYVFNWLGYQEVTFPMKREEPLWYMQFSDYRGYLLLALGLMVISVVLSILIERSRFGRSLLAIKQDELAAEASGVDTFRWKMRALILSGALAAAAGGLYGVVVLVITPGSVFGLVVSAQPIVLSLFGGAGIVWGPIIGAVILLPVSETLHAEFGSLLPGIQGILYGVAIILVTLLAPEGIYWRVKDLYARRRDVANENPPGRAASGSVSEARIPGAKTPAHTRVDSRREVGGGTILEVRGLSKSFGGLKAIKDISFDVKQGEILGIIGPNGAGKTTLFNLLNGIAKPNEGRIRFDGKEIAGLKPSRICSMGIGRTFQVVRAFRRMPLVENVLIGAYVADQGESGTWELARKALDDVGLSDRAGASIEGLTSKELRLMELARALAPRPRLLLLDEPLAGLGSAEAAELMEVVATLPARGVTVVLIEHTVGAMIDIVDRFLVLDHGSLLADGAPRDVVRKQEVVEAYLGQKWAARNA